MGRRRLEARGLLLARRRALHRRDSSCSSADPHTRGDALYLARPRDPTGREFPRSGAHCRASRAARAPPLASKHLSAPMARCSSASRAASSTRPAASLAAPPSSHRTSRSRTRPGLPHHTPNRHTRHARHARSCASPAHGVAPPPGELRPTSQIRPLGSQGRRVQAPRRADRRIETWVPGVGP